MTLYRIVKVSNSPIVYRASVPMLDDTVSFKKFSSAKHPDPLKAAQDWQRSVGIVEWGAARWNRITRRHLSHVKGKGVNCHRGYTYSKDGLTKYYMWVVSWRIEGGKQKSKIFSIKRYGTEREAKKMANLFASQLRAIRSCSTLHILPEILLS